MGNRIWIIPRTDGKYDAVAINDNGDGTVTLKILEKGKPEYPFLFSQFDFANSKDIKTQQQGNFVPNVFTQSGSLITSSGTTPVELPAGSEQNVLRILSGLPKYSRLGQWLIVNRTSDLLVPSNSLTTITFNNLISRSSGEAASWWSPNANEFTISATNPPTPILVVVNFKLSWSSTTPTLIQALIKGPNTTIPPAYHEQTAVAGTTAVTVTFTLTWIYTPTQANELISVQITSTTTVGTSLIVAGGTQGTWAAVYAL